MSRSIVSAFADVKRILGQSVAPLVLVALAAHSAQAQEAAVPKTREEQARAWQEIASLPDFWQGTWQSISPIADDFPTPPDYTDFARDYIANYRPAEDSPFTNCVPLGMPFVENIGGMPMKFFQSPGMIALYIESSGMTRFIHTDGRALEEDPNPTYLGTSIGRWEGDTLVVETYGLAPDTVFQLGKITDVARLQGDPSPIAGVVFGPHGPNLRLVERMRLVDFNTLEIQTTLHDETIFHTPYALPPRLYLRGIERHNEPQEWACTDNRDYLDLETGELEINSDRARSRN